MSAQATITTTAAACQLGEEIAAAYLAGATAAAQQATHEAPANDNGTWPGYLKSIAWRAGFVEEYTKQLDKQRATK